MTLKETLEEHNRQVQLNYFKRKLIDILLWHVIQKALKANVGEIHDWKNGRYKKVSDGKWLPVKEDEKTNRAAIELKRRIDLVENEEDLMRLILGSKQYFTDGLGFFFPVVKELDKYIDAKHAKLESGGYAASNGGNKQKDFEILSNVLKNNTSTSINNLQIGKIFITAGETGKHGYGLKHIIEQRLKKDGKSVDEITALLALVLDAAKNGDVVRENDKNFEIEKNGIIAIIAKQRFEKKEKWILTGFDDWNKKEEATDAIKTVIADNSYTPEYSYFCKQVGAVVSSLLYVDKDITVEQLALLERTHAPQYPGIQKALKLSDRPFGDCYILI